MIENQTARYPVHICCVVDNYADANSCKIVRSIKEHTLTLGGLFSTRIYDSRRKSEDRNVITRLPAFHVYVERAYIRTFYTNTRPIQHVDESIEMYTTKMTVRERRKELWANQNLRAIDWIKRLFRRKTKREVVEW